MKRPECQGCVFEGKTVRCAALELEWALYEALITIPFFRPFATKPAPCDLREVAGEESATRKPEGCRYYTENSFWGVGRPGCLGTKEIDPCKGASCENWTPKED